MTKNHKDNKDKMTDDKFILMGLNDESSKNVAEVLKSEKAKKILDFLGDIKEASEKDISDKLSMPINTVEYNLKKLVKSGLVDKSKNFFWSVKGKKIPMYKLAKKHIIIGHKKPSASYIKSILPVIVALALVAVVALVMLQDNKPVVINDNVLRQFESQAELNQFIKNNTESNGFWNIFGGGMDIMMAETTATGTTTEASPSGASDSAKTSASDYSETNIQVEGVDEADIVKNDGKYIYIVNAGNIVIVNAYPAKDMEILSEIDFDGYVNEIFIKDDKLIVFSYKAVYIYDVLDKKNPELEKEIVFDGSYVNSRMIGDYVYVISNKYINARNPEPPIYEVDGVKSKVAVTDISYWPYLDSNYVFTSIMAINVDDGEFNSEVYLTGRTANIYVSEDNIYLTYMKRTGYKEYVDKIADEVYLPLFSSEYDDMIQDVLDSDDNDWEKLNEMKQIAFKYSEFLIGSEKADFDANLLEKLEKFEIKMEKQLEKTIIHKINIDKDKIEYEIKGEVPGHILNQFSMDEYDGYFRIVTTTGNTWRQTSLNHLYVLDEDLDIVGSVEDLAKGERIYSARFMGDRAYMVTFRQVDPFYAIDLSDAKNPEVLGYLKIPGYSSYLHAYDEEHIIGIGVEDRKLKLSLFDVSDIENIIEVDKYVVDSEYSNSQALNDHKAFLFDKARNLLVIPVNYYKVVGEKFAESGNTPIYEYWQGAFVFNINSAGFELKSEIGHDGGEENNWNAAVKRSLHMDDVLYTISSFKIMANELDDLDYINSVELPEGDRHFYYWRGGVVDEVEVSG